MKNLKALIHELKHHIPFTATATIIAFLLVLILNKITIGINETLFESMHILHILASSIVTAGIFYKYKRNTIYAIFVGILGAIVIGSLSDVFFPWFGGLIFNLNTEFHLPLFEIPLIVFSCALVGSLIGIKTGFTKIPHTFHVGISVFASIFYLTTFTPQINYIFVILSFLIVFISVIIPCCVSDILFPFFFLGNKIKHCSCK